MFKLNFAHKIQTLLSCGLFILVYPLVIGVEQSVVFVPDDYETIQLAIDEVEAGSLIIVKDGDYFENLVIDKSVEIYSENGPIKSSIYAEDYSRPVITIKADNVAIGGFKIISIDLEGERINSHGFLIQSDYCYIENNLITVEGSGIQLESSNNNILFNNTIEITDLWGMFIIDSSFNMIL